MKTTTNEATQNQKAQNATPSFEEVLRQEMANLEKKLHQVVAVTEAVRSMIQKLEEDYFLIADVDLDITECPCENNCGSIKVSIPFTAMTYSAKGIETHRGEISSIIVPNE